MRVLAESSTNVWATVEVETGSPVFVLLHWNGHRWHLVTGRRPAGELSGPLAPDGRGGVWLAAYSPAHVPFMPFLVHYLNGR